VYVVLVVNLRVSILKGMVREFDMMHSYMSNCFQLASAQIFQYKYQLL